MFATNGGVGDVASLTAQQAQWLLDTHDWRGHLSTILTFSKILCVLLIGASDLFLSLKDYMQAAKVVIDSDGKSIDRDTCSPLMGTCLLRK